MVAPAIKIFVDAGSLEDLEKFAEDERISGATTNPSLLKKAGITDYAKFASLALDRIKGKPISFEVLADDWPTMEEQARKIQSWGENVWCKIPCQSTSGESCERSIDNLDDCHLNVTAIFTPRQYALIEPLLKPDDIASMFAGRIMDTGVRPKASKNHNGKLLWASTRAIYDVITAEVLGFDIITVSPELLKKFDLFGKDLEEYSLSTVKQFYDDGQKAGLTI